MGNFSFKDLFDFDKMITPKIIKLIYILILGIIALISLSIIIMGLNSYDGGGALVFIGLIFLIVSPITARINCEMLVVVFKIYEKLSSIDNSINREKIM